MRSTNQSFQLFKEESLKLWVGKLIILFGVFIFSAFPSITPSPETNRTQTTLVAQVARISRRTVSYQNAFYFLQGKVNSVVIQSTFTRVLIFATLKNIKKLILSNNQFLEYKNLLESFRSLLATHRQSALHLIS